MPVVTSPTRPRRRANTVRRRPGLDAPARLLSAVRTVSALAPDGGAEQQAIDELARMVIEVAGTPIDERGVAATLESRGMRDLDAVERYGKRDIFDLADDVYARARVLSPGTPTWVQPRKREVSKRSFLLAYLRGGFSFLPLLVQMLLLITIGYSQFGWVHFSDAQSSTVALGVGLGLVGTAGLIQVIGYLGPLFSEAQKHTLARRTIYRTLALGMLTSLVLAAVVFGILLATGAYPAARVGQALAYDLLVSAVWLLNGILYMLRRQPWILGGIALSVGVVALVLNASSWGIYAAHWLGLLACVGLQLLLVGTVLRRRAASTSKELRAATFPRAWVLRPTVIPLFVYGSAYFVMLIADRFAAWTAGHHPLPLWFNVQYELGLDVALFAAAVGIAFLECGLHAFTKIALPRQDHYSGLDISEHNQWYIKFFLRQVLAVIALLCVGALITVGLVTILHDAHALGRTSLFYSDPVARRVFLFGLAGYGLVALGICSCGVLFNVGRARLAGRAAIVGAVVDLVVGLVLSRTVGFSWAAAGLTAGAAVYALMAGRSASDVLRRADYHLYAAY